MELLLRLKLSYLLQELFVQQRSRIASSTGSGAWMIALQFLKLPVPLMTDLMGVGM